MNEDKAFKVYAWRYRKGKKIDLIETTVSGLFHMQQSKWEDEEIVVIRGFARWWHVNVRLNWEALKVWVREWTLDRTAKLAGILVAITGLIVFVENRATNHDEREDTQTPTHKTESSNEAPLEQKLQPLLLGDSISTDTIEDKK